MTAPTIDPGFSTDTLSAIFSPPARVAAMCRFEAALAHAQADVGLVPAEVARRIGDACDDGIDDADVVLRQGWEDGTPVVPLLGRLREALDDEAVGWLHHGATTQDVVDTAGVLQLQAALPAVRRDLLAVARSLRDVVDLHRATPAEGWTFLQPAVPTTVGRRAAGWLSAVVGHAADLRVQTAGLPVQLGGPTGTLDALGDHGPAVVEALAARLDLVAPVLPWHTDRGVLEELVGALQRTGRTMAHVGTDLALLAHHGAVRMRAGGSSSMPGKRNPIDAVRAVAAAEACHGVAAVVTAGRPHELERGVGGWHAEWFALPLVVQTAGAAAEAIARATSSLEVVTDEGEAATTRTNEVGIDRVLSACDAELAR